MFFPYPFPSITKKQPWKKLSSRHQSCQTPHIVLVLFFCQYFTVPTALCIESVSHLAVWKRQLFFPPSESRAFTNKGSLAAGKQGGMLGDEQFGEAERIQCEVQWPYLSFSLLPGWWGRLAQTCRGWWGRQLNGTEEEMLGKYSQTNLCFYAQSMVKVSFLAFHHVSKDSSLPVSETFHFGRFGCGSHGLHHVNVFQINLDEIAEKKLLEIILCR